jgi:hypothetical protein
MDFSTNDVGGGNADLLGLGEEYDFVSPERRASMAALFPIPSDLAVKPICLIDDMPMEVDETPVRADLLRQGDPNGANRMNGQAPDRDLNFDKPRGIRTCRSRQYRDQIPPHWRSDHHAPTYSTYYDYDDTRGRANRNESQFREPSTETLRSRAEATYVAHMADVDVKEDRGDRRDGADRHRGGGGGNNKRRRDGKLAIWQFRTSYQLMFADDNDNYSRDRGRGPQRRRQDDAPPRRRYEEPPFPKLRRLLLNIASSTKLPQDEAIEIAKLFGEHYDDDKLRSDFFDVFVQL